MNMQKSQSFVVIHVFGAYVIYADNGLVNVHAKISIFVVIHV